MIDGPESSLNPEDGVAPMPAYIRASGVVRLRFCAGKNGTKLIDRQEGGGYLIRTPGWIGGAEAVLINTGGGMAGGDRLSLTAETMPGAAAMITTQTAEKIYRSDGPPSRIDIALQLQAGSRLDWLPQETILFSGARLDRSLTAALSDDATLTLGESVVFGRIAMPETLETGSFHDLWRIRRNDKLIFAENIALPDRPAQRLAAKAAGDGARAMATILHVGADAESRLDDARTILGAGQAESGASAWDGMLLLRFLSPDAQALRADFTAAMEWLRGTKMPRCW